MAADITLAIGAGEYMETATLVAWTVSPGMAVKAGDVVAVVETAKAATEIVAPADGILLEILAPLHAEVELGAVLGRIGKAEEMAVQGGDQTGADMVEAAADHALEPVAEPMPPPRPAVRRPVASPLARRLAAAHGIDLHRIQGTGPNGRIKRRDLEAALARPEPVLGEAGIPIVLLHGFGASKANWAALLPRLQPHGRVIRIELPGHGQQRRTAQNLSGMVAAVLAELDELGLLAVHLVGHSLGGAIAAKIATLGKIEIRSLTLLAPAGLGPDIDGAFLDGFLRATRPESLRPWLGRLVADPDVLPEGFAAAVLRERCQEGLALPQQTLAQAVFPDGTQAIEILDDLRRLTMPLRVIWGLQDAIIPASQARHLPGSVAVHRLEGVGHMPHVEAPDLVARLILETCRSGTARE